MRPRPSSHAVASFGARTKSRPIARIAFAIWLATAPAHPAAAGEEAAATDAATRQVPDPCGFYRTQAYGRGLDHFLTEMLWVCEAIEARRRADLPMSDRMVAAEQALERYRLALVEATAARIASIRTRQAGVRRLDPADAIKASLADSTGVLATLEAMRYGY